MKKFLLPFFLLITPWIAGAQNLSYLSPRNINVFIKNFDDLSGIFNITDYNDRGWIAYIQDKKYLENELLVENNLEELYSPYRNLFDRYNVISANDLSIINANLGAFDDTGRFEGRSLSWIPSTQAASIPDCTVP